MEKTEVITNFDYEELLLQAVAVLPWGHILDLMTNKETKDNDDAILYYAEEAANKGWSREILMNAIKLEMYGKQGAQSLRDNNFETTLPAAQAQYANEKMFGCY